MPRASARSSASASTTSASASARSSSTAAPPSASRPRASWSASRIPSRRCCAPSWRSRSRPPPLGVAGLDDPRREARTSASWARSSACRRAFSSARPAAAPTAWTSSGSSSSDGSWTSAARRFPSCSSTVTARPGSASGTSASVGVDVALLLGEPEGELERGVAERARDRVAHLRGRGTEPSSTTSSATAERCIRVRRRPARNASGIAAAATTTTQVKRPRADRPDVTPIQTVKAARRSPSPTAAQPTGAIACRAGGVARRQRRMRSPNAVSTIAKSIGAPRSPIPSVTPESLGAGAGCAGNLVNRPRPGSRRGAKLRCRRPMRGTRRNDRALDPRRESAAWKGDDEVYREGDAPRLDEDAQREGQRRVP